MAVQIPLSLYVHIPWCVQKCPYCDFNSHTLKGEIPEQDYISALLDDLQRDLVRFDGVSGRHLHSIFIGGGTPSLMSPQEISRLLNGIDALIPFKEGIEITMEANPGTVEADKFIAYQSVGVNRISVGVQSFDNAKLERLGRIHGSEEAKRAAKLAHEAGLNSFNLDLMHGLPDQTLQSALSDLKQAIELDPPHLSWYQLTIEPNTQYYSKPPVLPDDDDLWDIFEQGHQLLTDAGYVQYETSGYSKPGYQCQHNLNYWRFGDYLGIGCGAHGKITSGTNTIQRTVKVKHPRGYLDTEKEYLSELHIVEADEMPFEFFMNRFRLVEPCPKADFSARTGLSLDVVATPIEKAIEQGLLSETETHWQVTAKGRLFLNDLLSVFINE
ncbi:YggW family oxidoreductase [Enterovibrio norvegicus FF-33]|uniref:Heme chaperone HemW n=1 Tax=Enterovibrio norvegicus FF-454 TaxID=1185651 RepID=A0A1E5CFM6_9GAMM|nr:radical SAM family heme chaperone HemW [Enterovibrio norvegicus]OEE64277.1 YggW family oxidoreductase [Enterovibrio norvegicus FF-454]OEE65333.1 YggW family oxidoreductase [Enterovibrio norvegicus FF-33]OEE87420.1 YggW family oxidoreductase [Enterovibrio norvegicus FF-162]